MHHIVLWITDFEWKKDLLLFLIPILLVIVIGILIIKLLERRISKYNINISKKYKPGKIDKVIRDNAEHEKLLNVLKENINSTISSRSLVGRIHSEIHNMDKVIKSRPNLKEQNLFILIQLNNTIKNRIQEIETRNKASKNILSERHLKLILNEQNLLISIDQKINEFINSYNNSSYLDKFSVLTDIIDSAHNEIAVQYQKLTEMFQEELLDINNE
jgi:hypothetical protein